MRPEPGQAQIPAAPRRRLYAAAPPGGLTGGAICALEHLQVLRADYEECVLVMCENSPLAERARQAGIPVWCAPFINRGLRRAGPVRFFRHVGEVVRSRWAYFAGLRRLLQERPGILHVHSRAAHLPYALLAARMARVPAVVTLHEPWYRGWEVRLDWLFVRVLARAVVFLTGDMQRQYPVLSGQRGQVICNHAALPAAGPKPEGPGVRIAMPARMSRRKGFDVFLETCRRLKAAGVPFTAEIAGGWGREDDRVQAAEFMRREQLEGVVQDSGVLADMEALYARTDVLLLTSRRDPFPRVVMEAMCRGIPVVATRVDGIPEMVADGETGFLVAPEDAAGFAEKTARLLADPELRRRMGAAGRARARQLFSPEAYCEKMRAVYAGLPGRPDARNGPRAAAGRGPEP